MKRVFFILVAVIGFGIGVNAQVFLSDGRILYLERIANGVGPSSGLIREYLNDIDWPASIESCAEQHDYDYGTYGKDKNEADEELRSCVASTEISGMTLREFINTYGNEDAKFNVNAVRVSQSIDLDTEMPDVFYYVMQFDASTDSWKEGQSLAVASMVWNSSLREEIKKHIEEEFGFSIADEEEFGRSFYIIYQ